MRLGLGTVQFGMDYGVSNAAGQVPALEVGRILQQAHAGGVELIDTAAAYGDAELCLGQRPESSAFRVVTKLSALPQDLPAHALADHVRAELARSCQRLQRTHVDGLLVHRAQDLLGTHGRALWAALEHLRADGLVRQIGASVYTAGEIDALLDTTAPSLVQLPVSLLDQRLLRSGHLAKLKARGVEVHARSLFLQGLLLMDPDKLPGHFTAARPVLQRLRLAARDAGVSVLQAAIAFAGSVPEIDYAICGVTSEHELQALLDATRVRMDAAWFADFAFDDEAILNPARWPVLR